MSAPRLITFNGETHSISDWARSIGLEPHTLTHRLTTYGWSVERALTTPAQQRSIKCAGREAFLAAVDGELTVDEYLAADPVGVNDE